MRYYLFDMLKVDGEDVTGQPLAERRSILERIADGADAVIAVPPMFNNIDAALAARREFALEWS